MQYRKELEAVHGIFVTQRASPPVAKNHPPVAGAIQWSRSLFYRIKRPIMRFQERKDLLVTEDGKAICREYLAVAKAMRDYEQRLYAEWVAGVEATTVARLKLPILTKVQEV